MVIILKKWIKKNVKMCDKKSIAQKLFETFFKSFTFLFLYLHPCSQIFKGIIFVYLFLIVLKKN